MGSFISKALDEIGIKMLIQAPIDAKLLCAQRFVRQFAYGAIALILVQYMSELGISKAKIGLFMTLTLLGDVVISFMLTVIADSLGRKNILAMGALLMILAGMAFATFSNYWVLLAASIIGVISPSGNEIGPFRAIEESILAQLSPKDRRSEMFAYYMLIGTVGAALGLMSCGWSVEKLQTHNHWERREAMRVIFYAYAVLGGIKFVLALLLSRKSELQHPPQPTPPAVNAEPATAPTETEPLLGTSRAAPAPVDPEVEIAPETTPPPPPTKSGLFPAISPKSRILVVKLLCLFSLDSFGSGLVTLSWISSFFTTKFNLPEGTLGTLFFITSLIAAVSNILAASIARRVGLVKTMVFTHLPSSLALALIPAPQTSGPAMALLVLRSCTSNMDTAPRQAFLSAAVLPSERTAIMGVVNVFKTLAQSGGPFVTGALSGIDKIWIAFVVAGAVKSSYDLGILAMFAGFKGREEEEDAQLPQNSEHPVVEGAPDSAEPQR